MEWSRGSVGLLILWSAKKLGTLLNERHVISYITVSAEELCSIIFYRITKNKMIEANRLQIELQHDIIVLEQEITELQKKLEPKFLQSN